MKAKDHASANIAQFGQSRRFNQNKNPNSQNSRSQNYTIEVMAEDETEEVEMAILVITD